MRTRKRVRVLYRKPIVWGRRFNEDEWEDLSAGGGDDQDKGK